MFEETTSKFQSILMRINEVIEQEGLKPGDRIPSERELVSRLNAGRSTVREALRALELLGIITTKQGQGTFLQPYQSHRLVDILAFYILRDDRSKGNLLEMRVLLETGAAKKAALHATAEEVAVLERIWSNMDHTVSQGQVPIQEDYDFHHQLIRSAHNHLLTRVWYLVIQYGQTVRKSSLSKPGRPQKALQEHHAILDAVRHRQPGEAAKRMEEHLASAGLPTLMDTRPENERD
ncbi:FadR/GntR family transcriptional regulator [Desmospora profundinema]|uniref:GntR family transcriptional repressor for pyruvate dehydrogenase complex n=1 Tax=Desmospora profundinema TaxID=1571184 RepID=A0ABU1IPH8_9BACL|nr:FadR/GntR family transcriptional regulator [Desmospora profundinema]MDR6226626.1 GntR family transcriptional repressor for pyruvate dehydrogenase complex [Desmospora profundinema]